MIAFSFLGNTLFLTILVSILSNTFAGIVSDASAEIQFRKSVLTLEGVKSDAIFAYQPPFNILAMIILVPLRFVVSPRWFHKIHVAAVRLVNLPLLLIIAALERRILWSPEVERPGQPRIMKPPKWFWERWNPASRQDIRAVFDLEPPEAVEQMIAVDDELTHRLIQRQFVHRGGSPSPHRLPRRRDSTYPGLAPNMRGTVESSDEAVELGGFGDRLAAVEESTNRIERMLKKLCSQGEGKRHLSAETTGDSQTLRDFE